MNLNLIDNFLKSYGKGNSCTLFIEEFSIGRPWDLYWDFKKVEKLTDSKIIIHFMHDISDQSDILLEISLRGPAKTSANELLIPTSAGHLYRPGYERKWSMPALVKFAS